MAKYSPKIDLVFKKIFGSEENKDILISLINAILNCNPKIVDLTIKNPYNLSTYVGGKTSILDIKGIDNNNTLYDIELQIGEQGFYGKRALYYLSKMYVDQLEEGTSYNLLNKTVGIHLIDFDYFPDERYKRYFVFKDMETNEFIENLSYQQLYFIELSKFNKDWKDVKTLLDRWIAFLNKAHKLDKNNIPEELKRDDEIVKALNKLEEISFNKEEKEIYEAERKKRLDAEEELRTAIAKGETIGRKEGKAIGIKEGKAIGIQEGKAIGIQEGIQHGVQQALQCLLDSGMTEEQAKKILKL